VTLSVKDIPRDSPGRTRAALWRRRMLLEEAIRRRSSRHEYPDAFQDSPKVVMGRWLLQLAGLYDQGVQNALRPELHTPRFEFEGLPAAFDGFRILHLSDFHFRGWPGFLERATSVIKDVEAGLCVLTGDFRYNNGAPAHMVYTGLARLLRGIHAPHGVFAVLGNNDTGDFAEGFRSLGIRVLVNQNVPLSIGNETIWLAGVDDPHDYRCDSLPAALGGIPNGATTILLAHSPEIATAAARCGVDVYLCGHTHGGQIRLPRVGALYRNTRCPYRLMQGEWQIGAMHGYTNIGLGTSTLPVRYNCRPEAAVITLARKQTT